MKYNKLTEMDISDLMAAALGQGVCSKSQEGPIQPNSNIGEFGKNQQAAEISVMKDDDGNIKIKTAGISINLDPAIIQALKQFINSEGENNG